MTMTSNATDVRAALDALNAAINQPTSVNEHGDPVDNIPAARAAFAQAADNARRDGPAPSSDVQVIARAAVRELDRLQLTYGPSDSDAVKSRTLDRLRRNVAGNPFISQLLLEVA